MATGRTNSGAGGSSGKSDIIVHAPTGSTVYIENQDGKQKTASEKNGTWTFRGCGVGTWTVHAALDDKSATLTVSIEAESQLMRYYVTINYQLQPSDFAFYTDSALTTPAVLGTHYKVVDDSDNNIPQADWETCGNWKIRNLVTLYCKALKDGTIDVFIVGGGGGAHTGRWDDNTLRWIAGGSGAYSTTALAVEVVAGNVYQIVIAAGGTGKAAQATSTTAYGGTGGTSSAFGHSAAGGTGGGSSSTSGQLNGTNRRAYEFGGDSGNSYGVGGSVVASGSYQVANTGNGGGGTSNTTYNGKTGIVIFRNARGEAA